MMASAIEYLDDGKPQPYSLVSSAATMEEGKVKTSKHRNVKGMGWFVTCLFIVGETAGGGLIALPTAMVNAGVCAGLGIIFLVALASTYTGHQLSENWTILQHRWPEYRKHCRKPYPAMAHKALGSKFGTIVSMCLNVTQFGTGVVFMLLAAKNIENFLHASGGIQIGFCYILVYVGLFMLPFTMLKSPKDFWWAVMFAMVTTTFAVSLIIYGAFEDYEACTKQISYPAMSYAKIFMSFGTVMFAFGGHGAFPTIQHDMKEPYKFSRSVAVAFIIICCMYLPVTLMGYFTYGDSLLDTIIPSIQRTEFQQGINLLITLHVILALTIVFNPLNQEFEDLLGIPQDFGWKRVAARSTMMLFVVIVGLTIPNFGVLLDLVGGSTITLMALIFPCIFNIYLAASAKKYNNAEALPEEPRVSMKEILFYTPKIKLAVNILVLVAAVIGGAAATISAMQAMINSEFSAPCYAGLWSKIEIVEPPIHVEHHAKFACCGTFGNISRFGTDYCIDARNYVGGGSHG